ncbi:hypothetical protein VTK56DRAFT_7608 [Thermocarpiscus australiensis]
MPGNPVAGKLDIVGSTLFSYVYSVVGDTKTVLKARELWCDGTQYEVRPLGDESALINEVRVYTALGDHPRITKFHGLEQVAPNVHALRLERLRMALDFAEGLSHCHSRGVLVGDFSVRNALLSDGFRVKLCDFGAATLKDTDFKPFQCYEVRYQLPPRGRDEVELSRMAEELFALGSAIHEVMEWQVPFWDVPEYELDGIYADDKLPELAPDNPAADIIRKCWQEAILARNLGCSHAFRIDVGEPVAEEERRSMEE